MTMQNPLHPDPHPGPLGDAFGPGKLLPGVHSRLVEELDRVAREAGITVQDITGHHYHLTDIERSYLLDFRRASAGGKLGLIYVGQHDPAVLYRGRSICGALIRNFVPARLIAREELVERLFSSERGPTADCVVVPDFHYGEAPVATRRALASWIAGRIARGGQTVLGVPSTKALKDVFTDDAAVYLNHFTIATGVNPAYAA